MERYLRFLADGLQEGKGVRLSRGGRQFSRAYTTQHADDELFDERILGSGDFVEQVLRAEELTRRPQLPLAEVISKAADYYQLSGEELSRPCRRAEFVQAKAVICYFAMRRLRLPASAVASRLDYTDSAVSKATRRGEVLYREDDVLQSIIK